MSNTWVSSAMGLYRARGFADSTDPGSLLGVTPIGTLPAGRFPVREWLCEASVRELEGSRTNRTVQPASGDRIRGPGVLHAGSESGGGSGRVDARRRVF